MDKEPALNYIKKKKRRKRAAILSGICSLGIAIFLIIAFNVFYVDRFTISTNNEPGLCLTIDEDKQNITSKLEAPPLLQATNIQYTDIPENIDEGLGSKNNTNQYFAYSFYLGASGEVPSINYYLTMSLQKTSKSLEEAMRVMVIKNGIRRIYAQANSDGSAKPIYDQAEHNEELKEIIGYTVPFKDNKHIILEPYNIVPGEFDRYTVVMWIDGWESVNSMREGDFQADLKFSTISINI